jgi:putative ABC transport system permease protein
VNTILMSVLERRQEIGILKTMGAMPGDIFLLVWTETLILCGVGGLAGIVLAGGSAKVTDLLIRRVLPYAPHGGLVEIDPALALLSLATIVAVGLASGLYPSWKAGRVRPLDSIRSEP